MIENASDEQLEELLKEALRQPYGVRVVASDADILRRKLYVLRRGVPQYEDLMLRISPEDHSELWIMRKAKDADSNGA